MCRFRAVAVFICILLVFLTYIPTMVDANWSMNRGNAAKTGVGTGNSILKPALLWNLTLAGYVESPPAVVDGIAYVGCDDGYVYALNASTGAQIWRCNIGHIKYSTPAVADGYLIVTSRDPYHIINSTWDSTPQLPNAYKGFVNAINTETGKTCWNRTFEVYASPPTMSQNIVYVTAGKCYALSESSGQVLWAHEVGGLMKSLSAGDGKVFTSGPYAFDAVTGRSIWIDSRNQYDYPIVANNTIYTANILGKMAAFKADTGEELWSINLSSWSSYAPAISDGVLFLSSKEHQLCALSGTNGSIIWNASVGSQAYGIAPVVVSDILYFSYFGGLYSFNATNGSQLWFYNMTAYQEKIFLTDVVVDNGTIYVASGKGVYAFVDESALPQLTTPESSGLAITIGALVAEAIVSTVVIATVLLGVWRYRRKAKSKKH